MPPTLRALCAATRLALDAAACSVARVVGEELVYEAADGAGAAAIVGTRLGLGRGIAGFVARTGNAMILDQLDTDDRFARDVAVSTGYVPRSLLAVPVVADDGAVVGVLSVLDRGASPVDPMAYCAEIATALASALAASTPGSTPDGDAGTADGLVDSIRSLTPESAAFARRMIDELAVLEAAQRSARPRLRR